MKIVLLGYMGSGKSSVGEKLALALGYDFYDLDKEIERTEGQSVSEIFGIQGEIQFRKKEALLLRKIIMGKDNLVLATGGGTPCYAGSMDFLLKEADKVITIYLKPSLQVLVQRLFSEKTNRPLVKHLKQKEDLEEYIRKHLFERGFYYNQAQIIIPIEEESISEIVEQIVLKLL